MKMNLFLTFYHKIHDVLLISNGFSFVKHIIDGEDIFVDELEDFEDIGEPLKETLTNASFNKIYASFSWQRQYNLVKELIDKRWLIGGPLSQFLTNSETGSDIRNETFESLYGYEVSSSFNYYFNSLIKKTAPSTVIYNMSLGAGCYWNRCRFCSHYERQYSYTRPSVETILEQIIPLEGLKSQVWTGLSAVRGDILKAVLDYTVPDTVLLKSYIRADPEINEVLGKYDDFTGKAFNVGLESFSQDIVDRLNKGIRIDNVFQLIERVISNNGVIGVNIMDNYGCMNSEMLQESLTHLEMLRRLVEKYNAKDRLFIINSGITKWPNLSRGACMESKMIQKSGLMGPYYVNVIPRNSEAYRCNREFAVALRQSGIPLSRES